MGRANINTESKDGFDALRAAEAGGIFHIFKLSKSPNKSFQWKFCQRPFLALTKFLVWQNSTEFCRYVCE